jgi:sugar O-acyltransferase (sialic acid O-acetyltransferase NeuD family)
MKNLIFIGAGDWALEVFSWLPQVQGYGTEWRFKGFLDKNSDALSNISFCPYPIITSEDIYEIEDNDVFVCLVAKPSVRTAIVEKMILKSAKFINLIHPTVLFFNNVQLGVGIVISPYCVVSNNVKIGNHVSINLACTLGHDVEIGDCCQISSQCDLTGHVKVGKRVMMGSRVSIIPKIKVYDDATIGAGSVVIRHVKAQQSVFGNPAMNIL